MSLDITTARGGFNSAGKAFATFNRKIAWFDGPFPSEINQAHSSSPRTWTCPYGHQLEGHMLHAVMADEISIALETSLHQRRVFESEADKKERLARRNEQRQLGEIDAKAKEGKRRRV